MCMRYNEAAARSSVLRIMARRLYPVMVETYLGRPPTGRSAAETAPAVEVALALREKGWHRYRIRFGLTRPFGSLRSSTGARRPNGAHLFSNLDCGGEGQEWPSCRRRKRSLPRLPFRN